MNYRKRNGFFVFWFSFVPGAVEMYMGFMKNGVSMLTVFVLALTVAMQGWSFFTYPLIGFAMITWVYSFFHAWNMYRLSGDILIKMEDRYIWTEFGLTKLPKIEKEKQNKVISWGLIICGGLLVYGFLEDVIMDFVPGDYWVRVHSIISNIPSVFFAVCMILVGLKLNKEKRSELGLDDDKAVETNLPPVEEKKEAES